MCLSPVHIRVPNRYVGTFVQLVPCGKCLECLKDRQNSWKLRLMEESFNWDYLYFFTLTYADDVLPLNEFGRSTACKKDVQYWLKRFRTRYKRAYGRDFEGKYFICAEYGPNGTHRPHYHGLLMTNSDEYEVSSLFEEWDHLKGFVDYSSIYKDQGERQAVANYVSKYCCKGEFASRVSEIQAGTIEKAWTIVSKGVGSSYVDRMKSFHNPYGLYSCLDRDRLDELIDKMFMSYSVPDGCGGTNVFKYKMPRYYHDRFFRDKFLFAQKFFDHKTNSIKIKYVKRFATKNPLACALSLRVRERLLEDYLVRLGCSKIEDYIQGRFDHLESQMALQSSITAAFDLSLRESRVRGSLFSFYQTNAVKWSHL